MVANSRARLLHLACVVAALACGCDGHSARWPSEGKSSGGRASMTDGGVSGGGASAAAEVGTMMQGGQMAAANGGAGGNSGTHAPRVCVFSRTTQFRHTSIEAGVAALRALAAQRGWSLEAGEDAGVFSDEGLQRFDVIVFLSTTGDVLDGAQQSAMERFIRAGGGFVGIHSASDTEYDWPWYGQLVGAYFKSHPPLQQASVIVEDPNHPASASLPSPWTRVDEWYAFRSNPREQVHVLLRVDEASYDPGESAMGADHPIAWCHEYDGGRACYSALGHREESYAEPLLLSHFAGAIEWAAGG